MVLNMARYYLFRSKSIILEGILRGNGKKHPKKDIAKFIADKRILV